MNAFTRLSARTLRRTPLRTAAILALVVVPVAASTISLSLAAGWIDGLQTTEDQRFGRTDLIITEYDAPGSAISVAEVARREGLDAASGVRVVDGPAVVGDDVVQYTEADLGDPLLDGFVEPRSGRLPERAGEAVVAIGFGDTDGRRLRTKIQRVGGFTAPKQPLRIVGVVANRDRPNSLIVHPGTIRNPLTSPTVALQAPRVQTLFAINGGSLEAQRIAAERSLEQMGPPTTTGGPVNVEASGFINREARGASMNRPGWAYVPMVGAAVVIMTWTSMVIASGLSVSAARRRRDLGILGVNGADPTALRRAVRADGMVLGVIGSALGLALAAPIAVLVDRLLQAADPLTTVRTGISPWLVMAPIIGVASTVFAGSIASNGVTRQSVSDLLAARSGMTPGRSVAKLTGLTLVAALGGTAVVGLLLAVPGIGGRPFTLLVAPVAAALVVVALASQAIHWLPRLVRRTGPTVRLAARDLQRFGSRTAAATAAIALTLSGATLAAAATAPPGAGGTVRSKPDVTTAPSPFTLSIQGAGLENAGGTLRSRPLSDSKISAIRAAVGDRATVEEFTVARQDGTGAAPIACADNARDLTPMAEALVDGCLSVTPILVGAEQLAGLPSELADPLRSDRAVAWSSINFATTPVNARLQVGERSVPLETPTLVPSSDQFGAPLDGMLGVDAMINVAVPAALWESSGLATMGRPMVVVRHPRADDAAASALYRSVAMAIGVDPSAPNDLNWTYNGSLDLGGAPSSPATSGPAIRGWVAGGITLLVLLVLALSLGLVRVETRQEESTLVHQGATPRQRAAVIAWRATLAVGIAAVVATAVISPLVAAATLNTGVRWPQWYWLLGMIVGLPAVAFGLFFASGLRSRHAIQSGWGGAVT